MEQDINAVENSINKRWYKMTIGALKVIPMLLALCSLLNTIFCTYNIQCAILSILGGISLLPLLFLYLASYVFQFCIYHRMFLHYILITNLLTLYDWCAGIPISNSAMLDIYLIIAGITLFLILYFYRKERCCRR